jgi:hypothetical protein
MKDGRGLSVYSSQLIHFRSRRIIVSTDIWSKCKSKRAVLPKSSSGKETQQGIPLNMASRRSEASSGGTESAL